MKSHLLVFDSTQVEKDVFRDKIDSMDSIGDWTLFFGNTMLLSSKKDVRELSKDIQRVLPNVRFILTAVDPEQKGGWLPRSLWRFLTGSVSTTTDVDA